ncbi:MAG: hypothetical protein ACREFQ_19990 [Stellaceae bacterium]
MAKKLAVLLLALCAAAPAWAVDTQGNYFVRGAGNQLCASYLKARQTGHAGAFADWLAGYITAFDRWTADVWRIENGNFDLSLIWMEDYCRDHPAETFDVAASNMIAFLYPNRVKSASGAPPGAIAGGTMR